MKTLLLKIGFCSALLFGIALNAQNECVKYSDTMNIPVRMFGLPKNESEALTYMRSIDSSAYLTNAFVKGYIDEYANNLEQHAIIFIQSSMKKIGDDIVLDDITRQDCFVLHEEFGEPSSYLWGTKKIMLVTIGPVDSYYTNKQEDSILRLADAQVEYETSFFKKSAQDLRVMSSSLTPMGFSSPITYLTMSITVLEPVRIKPPCTIVISHKIFKEDYRFKVHEKNMASFQVGVSSYQLDKKQFQISNQQLVVSLDSTQQKEWKSNMILMFELHLPRDVDWFEPLWQRPHLKGQGKKKFGYGLYYYTFYRTGVFGGLRFSKDPLQSIYGGFNYAVSKDFYVNFGWSWHNEYKPSVTNIGDIQSVKDAKEFADRDYGKPAFFWGISMSPSAMIETLGLKKE